MNIRFLFLLFALACIRTVQAGEFVWYNGKDAVSYHFQQRNVSPVVHVALDMFADDMRRCGRKVPEPSELYGMNSV